MKLLKASALMAVMLFCSVMMLTLVSMRGAPAAPGIVPAGNGDVNCDGKIDITDGIYTLQWLFTGGQPPCAIAQDGSCPELVEQMQALQTICSKAAPPPPLEIHCSRTDGGIRLTWTNPTPYDSIEVKKNGQLLVDLVLMESEYLDPAFKPGETIDYSIRGKISNVVSAPSSCSVEIPSLPILGQCLVASNQTACYGQVGKIDCGVPPAKGQDGYYQLGCPAEGRFMDNGDGTITDRCTGRMWTQKPLDINGDFEISDKDEKNWAAAITYVEDLQFAGHDDWRMPNVEEWFSIIDFSKDPLAPYDPFDYQSRLWTSTTTMVNGNNAWMFDMDNYLWNDPRVGGLYGDMPLHANAKDRSYYVVAVRTSE